MRLSEQCLITTALFGAAPLARAQDSGSWHGMMGHWGWDGGWGAGMIGMAFWWLLILVAIVLLAKRLFGSRRSSDGTVPSQRALEILKERYARGEIGKEEYEQKKRDLAA